MIGQPLALPLTSRKAKDIYKGTLPARRMLTLHKRPIVTAALCASVVLFCGSIRAQTKISSAEPMKYLGPGSCAATSCHGSVKPVAGSRILQTEYSTWILKDKHSRAYQALTGDVGERMARILKLGAKAEESPKCLVCHALYTKPEQRGRGDGSAKPQGFAQQDFASTERLREKKLRCTAIAGETERGHGQCD